MPHIEVNIKNLSANKLITVVLHAECWKFNT